MLDSGVGLPYPTYSMSSSRSSDFLLFGLIGTPGEGVRWGRATAEVERKACRQGNERNPLKICFSSVSGTE
jgi:hypothetical protein